MSPEQQRLLGSNVAFSIDHLGVFAIRADHTLFFPLPFRAPVLASVTCLTSSNDPRTGSDPSTATFRQSPSPQTLGCRLYVQSASHWVLAIDTSHQSQRLGAWAIMFRAHREILAFCAADEFGDRRAQMEDGTTGCWMTFPGILIAIPSTALADLADILGSSSASDRIRDPAVPVHFREPDFWDQITYRPRDRQGRSQCGTQDSATWFSRMKRRLPLFDRVPMPCLPVACRIPTHERSSCRKRHLTRRRRRGDQDKERKAMTTQWV